VLHSGFGSQPDARQRFEREARAISGLNHRLKPTARGSCTEM
jgi:hypothetical protein